MVKLKLKIKNKKLGTEYEGVSGNLRGLNLVSDKNILKIE